MTTKLKWLRAAALKPNKLILFTTFQQFIVGLLLKQYKSLFGFFTLNLKKKMQPEFPQTKPPTS